MTKQQKEGGGGLEIKVEVLRNKSNIVKFFEILHFFFNGYMQFVQISSSTLPCTSPSLCRSNRIFIQNLHQVLTLCGVIFIFSFIS